MIITSLLENTTHCNLQTEHGLSLFVESEHGRFLFDMGHTDLFARNAEKLSVDLNTADFAVLSHGHYDHGGGIGTFLSLNDHAPVYVNRHAFEPHFSEDDRDIGLDSSYNHHPRIIYVDEELTVAPGIRIISTDSRQKIMDAGSGGLKMMQSGQMLPEDYRHEQYLLVEERGRRILFSGCSHRGILNVMHWFHPDVLIGGFHVFHFPLDEALAGWARQLDAFPTVYYTCHCTGVEQFAFMSRYMHRLHYLATGDRIEV